jgi:hypothetical protein
MLKRMRSVRLGGRSEVEYTSEWSFVAEPSAGSMRCWSKWAFGEITWAGLAIWSANCCLVQGVDASGGELRRLKLLAPTWFPSDPAIRSPPSLRKS